MNNRKALIIAVLTGLGAVILTQIHLYTREKNLEGRFESVLVMVATKDILRYDRIDEESVTFQKIPKPYVQPLAVLAADKDKILGQNMADVTIKAGEQITKTKLSLMGEGGISPLIPSGMRACTIAINEITGVAGLIRNRDTVDVLGTFRTGDQKSKLASGVEGLTLIQNVTVLAVGRNYLYDRPQEQKDSKKLFSSQQGSLSLSNITLLLTPRQCMDLAVAQETGELTLALRSYLDRFGSKPDPTLKDQHSTPESVTGIKTPVQISEQPRWLEIRGNESMYTQ